MFTNSVFFLANLKKLTTIKKILLTFFRKSTLITYVTLRRGYKPIEVRRNSE